MEFRGIKIDLVGAAQLIMAMAAALTAWRGMKKAAEKKSEKEHEDGTNDKRN